MAPSEWLRDTSVLQQLTALYTTNGPSKDGHDMFVRWNASSDRVGATKDTMGYVCPNACAYCPRQNRISTDTLVVNITNITGRVYNCSGDYERNCLLDCNATANVSAPMCLVDFPPINYVDNLERVSIEEVGQNRSKCEMFSNSCNERCAVGRLVPSQWRMSDFCDDKKCPFFSSPSAGTSTRSPARSSASRAGRPNGCPAARPAWRWR